MLIIGRLIGGEGICGPMERQTLTQNPQDKQRKNAGAHTPADAAPPDSSRPAPYDSSGFLQAVLDSLPAHLAVLDAHGKIVAVNTAWVNYARSSGLPDVTGVCEGADYLAVCRRAADLADPLAREALEGIEAVLHGRMQQFTLEYPCHSPTERHWYLMQVSRPAPGLAGAVVTHLDVTERTLARKEVERAREALEMRVSERTAELHQRANQLARLASELTLTEQRERRRLARLLHDHLQQLLVSAKFSLEVLSHRVTEERHRGSIRRVSEMLDESIEASRSLTIELSPPVLHDIGLVAGLEWLARRLRDTQGLQVDLDLTAPAVQEREDVRILLFQAVRELLHNVVQHAGVGRARVRMAPEGQDRVRIVVHDEGVGFDPSAVRGEARDVPGGLGLFSIHERLALLGGRMEISSALHQGSTIVLVAPLHPQESVPPAARIVAGARAWPKAAAPPGADAGDRAQRTRVLLVDDHVVMRQGLSLLLGEQPDLEVVGEASDGVAGVEMARELRPDVILMDMSLPHMNGEEATRLIHAELPDICVIGLSMFEEADRAAAMRAAGAAAYVTKSGAPEVLLATIRSLRDQRPPDSE